MSVKPTLQDISYGPHERNVIDIFKAPTDDATSVFLWLHGGGFCSGDKSAVTPEFVSELNQAGVSLAAANYRLSQHAIYPAPYHDCRRALQFIRHHSSSWGLDPARIAVGGSSAGAGMALWLAFRPDMADPSSEDPVERQSTKPTCAFSIDGQTSYDPRFIRKTVGGRAHLASGSPALFGVPDESWPGLKGTAMPELSESVIRLVEDASPVNFLDSTAPPVLTIYSLPRRPPTDSDDAIEMIHHPRFGEDLKLRMDDLGLNCTIIVDGDLLGGDRGRMKIAWYLRDFLKMYLISTG